MEAVTAGADARHAQGTGSKTIADLLPLAVEKYGDAPAQRYKVGRRVARPLLRRARRRSVKEVALGLIDLGIAARRQDLDPRPHAPRVDPRLLRHPHRRRRPSVTIYQTNSPEECQYVLSHSDSRAVFVEDAEQLAKIREVEGDCPELEHVIVLDPGDADIGDALTLDALRERGRGARRARSGGSATRPSRPRHLPLHLHVGHDRPAQGLPALARQLPRDHRRGGRGRRGRGRRLHLPVPPARARVRDPDPVRRVRAGRGDRLLVADPQKIIADLAQVKPTLLPVGAADVREDLHARDRERRGQGAPAQGRRGRASRCACCRTRGEAVPEELQAGLRRSAEEQLFKNVRDLFGQNIRECVTGAAPIAPEILEFFYACGVPVMEGYGMTETSTSATVNRPQPASSASARSASRSRASR